MEERLRWDNWDPVTEFEDERKWRTLYEQAEDRNQSQIEAIAKGLRLKKYDQEMAYLYGYKVVEDVLKDDYSDLWEKSTYSEGRIGYFLSEVKTAFKRTSESEDVLEHIEAVEEEVDRLDDFPRKEMIDVLLQESGFYTKMEESKESTKDLYLWLYARRHFDIDADLALAAYNGEEEAVDEVRKSFKEDYEQIMSQLEDYEGTAKEEAVDFTDDLLDAWENRSSLIPDARNPMVHRPNHEISPALADATLHLAKYLVEESVAE